jgi:hypothetical protein
MLMIQHFFLFSNLLKFQFDVNVNIDVFNVPRTIAISGALSSLEAGQASRS